MQTLPGFARKYAIMEELDGVLEPALRQRPL